MKRRKGKELERRAGIWIGKKDGNRNEEKKGKGKGGNLKL
jgi:hypothetical protein